MEVTSRDSIDPAQTDGFRLGGRSGMLTRKQVAWAQDLQHAFPLVAHRLSSKRMHSLCWE